MIGETMEEKYIHTGMHNIGDVIDYSLKDFCFGWKTPLTEIELRNICKNSTHHILAIDEEVKRIVGIITALSDNVNFAFIPYLEVITSYQKMGIGSKLFRLMLEKLKNIKCVDLTCDENMQSFYEKFNMSKSQGMIIRK
jgi:ribosomal protein S18 acetylase RimI-like enzyme